MASKEEWKQGKRHTDTVYMADENTRIATCFSPNSEANAQLIVTAVNACQKVNPDNPQAVAESISDFYEALKKIVTEAKENAYYHQVMLDNLGIMQKALAKVRRNK